MWNKSIGLIILLKITSILTSRQDEIIGSRTTNENRIVGKVYELIFVEVTWYTANQFCLEHNMQLASINTHNEQQHLDMLIKDKDKITDDFWVSKGFLAQESALKRAMSIKVPGISKWDPSKQCIFWYWLNMELCATLSMPANEWNYDSCNKKKYFVCERILAKGSASIFDSNEEETSTDLAEKELVKYIEEEFTKLVDEMMLLDLVDALETTTEDAWVSFVKSGLYMWVEEQQQILNPKSPLREEANMLAKEVKMMEMLQNYELSTFVKNKFDMLTLEERLPLLNERFCNLISDEAIELEEKAKSAANKSGKSLWDEMIILLVERVILLAKEKRDELRGEIFSKSVEEKPTDTLDEEVMKAKALDLLKLSEEEFKTYVLEAMKQFEQWGVEEFDMEILYQLFILVKQELFTFIAKTASKATLEERIDIVSYGLSRILEGNIGLTEQRPIFGQIFVLLALELVILTEKEFVTLDDEDLRKYVRKEFKGLSEEDIVDLSHDGYMKFIIDEFIKLASEPESAKNESGQLLLNDVISLIASQLFWFADDEMKVIAERLSKLRVHESNKYVLVFQILAQSTEGERHKYEEDKLFKLFSLIEQELFKITSKSLGNFTEQEIVKLAEEGLSKLLSGDLFKSIEGKSIFGKVLNSLAEELSKLTEKEFENLNDEKLHNLVISKLQMENYEEGMELFEEASLKLMADEFIKFTKEGTSTLTVEENGKHQFGEIVQVLAEKLLKTAEK